MNSEIEIKIKILFQKILKFKRKNRLFKNNKFKKNLKFFNIYVGLYIITNAK